MKYNEHIGRANAAHQRAALIRQEETKQAMADTMGAMARLGTMVDAPEFNEASCKLVALRGLLEHAGWELDWGTPRK